MFKRTTPFQDWPNRLRRCASPWLPGPKLHVSAKTPLVSFTFDDVPENAWREGAAILERHGVRGTYYVCGGLLEQQQATGRMISEEGCRALAGAGHEIGCHTFSHSDVAGLSLEALQDELDRNAAFLERIDPGRSLRNFAYPYNSGSILHRAVFTQRFATARAGGDRINRGRINRSYLYGMEIRQPECEARLLVDTIDALARSPGWLIFYTHDICDQPTPYGCTGDTLSLLVSHALAKGCQVLTVRDAFAALRRNDP